MVRPRLTVATCQFPVTNDVTANTLHVRRQLDRAAARGADIAHFPELAITGYGYPDRKTEDWKSASRRRDWATIRANTEQIRQACRDRRIWAVVGSSHSFNAGERPTNCVYVFDAAGDIVGRYDKQRCSQSDLHNHTPGDQPLTFEIKGVPCGVSICLEWSFPDIFADYADAGVDLMFHSANTCGDGGDTIHTHTIPQTMQGYAFTTNMFISVSNAAQRSQAFPSFWVRRSGRSGAKCRRNMIGMLISEIGDEPEKDDLYRFIRAFRKNCRDGSFYSDHRSTNPKLGEQQTLGG